MLGESCLTLGKNDGIDKAAREWASVIKNAEARKDAEAAARILLSHGIKLPRLMKRKLGATVGAEYSAPIGEGFDGILYFNERRERDYKSYKEKKMKYGSGAQDNTFLHELGHHIDCMLEPKAYSTVEHQWDMKGVNKELIQKELSRYALQNRAEFEAELISATLRGRTFSKELLSYSNLNAPEKMDELAGKLLGYASGKDLCTPSEDLRQKFEGMMRALYKEEGASLRIDILAEPAAQEFISLHTDTLNGSFKQVEMSDIMRRRLSRSNYVFSGMKAFHELNEAFPSLLDENGNRKTFERFLKDVQSIDAAYNSNYLRSEFNFVQASAEMAAKWEGFMQDGDRYYLQYRTANDGKVRPEHAALHGVTLPITDSFWEEYYPPNGWNCRCTVVQVRKSRYPATPHDEAMALGEEALQRDTKGMFRFNPGKQEKAVPDYNPYTISRCRDCDIAKGKAKLAKAFIPDNELCQACQLLQKCAADRTKSERAIERTHYLHTMEPLLKKSVTLNTEGKDIRVGFTTYGNKHLFSDTFGRSSVLTRDDLATLDKVLETAIFIDSSPLTHPRNDGIERFFYYEATIRGQKVRLNVAKKVWKQRSGYIQESYFLYSINDMEK